MKALCLLALTAGLVVADDPAKADLDKLRGDWLGVKAVVNGETGLDLKEPPKFGTGPVLSYDGHKWQVKFGKKVLSSGTSKLDPTKTPKWIDVTHETGPNKGKTLLGIYELDGDTYTACLAAPGKDRPTEFASKKGSGQTLLVNKRAKP